MNSDKTKTYFWGLLNLFLVAAIINLVFFVMPAIKKFGESFSPARTTVISAEGKTIVSPDIANLSFSVASEGKDPKSLADNNNKKISAAIDFVKSKGVDAKDIKTTNYNLTPVYEYDKDSRRTFISGYNLTQTVTVKVRDLTKVAEIIGGLPPLGINQLGGISFSIDDPEKFLGEARAEAFVRIRVKAEDVVKNSGLRLGKIVNVSENQNSPVPYYRALGSAISGADSAVAPTIEPGTQELKVQLSVTYALE